MTAVRSSHKSNGSGDSPVGILLVDDDATKRFALKAIVAPLGQNVIEAASGADALRQLLREDFAVVLLDVRMPVMDGFETAQLIRQRPRSELTPIIFVTALDQTASALHVAALVLALVIVPVATELPETLNSVLWVRSNDDALAFGNVAGSATFQSCVLAAIGVVFTTWNPGPGGLISAGLTIATAAFLLALLWRGTARGGLLALAVLPWLVYVAAQVVAGGRLAL